MITLGFHVVSPFSGTLDYTGTPLRAAFLNLMRECNHKLSEEIHETGAIRQYSLHPFPFNREFRTNFNEGEEYTFGVNLLDADKFKDAIRNIALGIGPDMRLHQHMFPIRRIDFNHDDASQLMTEWTEPVKEMDAQSIRVSMRFETPTQLSVYGSDYASVLPQPERIFATLSRIWGSLERSSTVEYTSEYRDWIEQNVHISRHRIRTANVPIGRSRQAVGFIGRVDYVINSLDTQLAPLTVGLARFAEFSNIGKNRTAGFGKVSVDVSEN